MPASKVSRVRSDGFSKKSAICFPANVPRKSAGRALIAAVRFSAM